MQLKNRKKGHKKYSVKKREEHILKFKHGAYLSEAKQIIESWRIDYNENRPQKGLKELTPNQFKSKLKSMKNSP